MPREQRSTKPRTFFLNENHELTPDEKGGGGGLPKFSGIDWAAKGKQISGSLSTTSRHIASSADPLKEKRFFLLAQPVDKVQKRQETKQGTLKRLVDEVPEYGGVQGKVFDRLGLSLIEVTGDGRAVVHGEKERIEHLASRAATLGQLGPLEQSRWASIASFEVVPLQLRVDADWLKGLRPDTPVDIVFELQPVLTRVEADRMLRVISELLAQANGEKLTGTGTDFSGRHWFRGKASQRSVRTIAKDFYSVQSIHPPLYSVAAGKSRPKSTAKVSVSSAAPADASSLPCVAIVDLGIPRDHKQLAPYRRGQFYPQDAPALPVGDHASFVASRVIFGDHDSDEELLAASGQCSVYDAMVGDYPGGGAANRVNDKIVMPAIQGVRGAAPDVRVFNLSFGDTRHLLAFPDVERREKRLALQDLDNFVFATDSIVVVAAGNSASGVTPNPAYPDHHTDARWALGPWACGYNTLVCGAFVSRLSAAGLVQTIGWPSPFTRIGPGLCDAPIPSFSAPGGNSGATYNSTPGMGVWGFSGAGLAEDRPGTSNAAPILAREAALLLADLQPFCLSGTNPFGVLVRAFLTLTALPPIDDAKVRTLVERTLGYGIAHRTRLLTPATGSAVLLWQGYIESTKDIVRVQIPIPQEWMAAAQDPVLRLVVCSDPPVNEAAHANWACRKVNAVLHPGPDTPAIRAPHGGHHSFPVMDRIYKLQKLKPEGEKPANTDIWLLEISYEEISPYAPGGDFDPRQRVAFAAELHDLAEEPVDPQSSIQKLPIAATMTRLSIQPAPIRTPIIVRTR